MARRKHYETSLLKRIRLATSRFDSLDNGLASGSTESIRNELAKIQGLREVVLTNLPAAERLYQSRQIWRKIREIEQGESQSRGLLKTIFKGALSESARAEIEGLKARIPQGDMRTDFREEVSGDALRAYIAKLEAYEQLLLRSIPSAEERERERITAANKRAAAKKTTDVRKIEKEARIVAMAAAHAGKTRQLAQTIRRNIEHQRALLPICPYCGLSLGDDPEADHIYPVARGGLSTEENMIFVCAVCNGRKRDMTLREFVKLMSFDLLTIEERLELPGKRF
jgi:5-methylcytosine-specific restriction endonuclease McrA